MKIRALAKNAVYPRTAGPLARLARKANLTFGVTYHRFEPEPQSDPKPGMAVTKETFKSHLEVLGNAGSFVTIDEALEPPASPGIRFFLCFDDGYKDNVDELLPILEDRDVPCCCFVVTDFVAGLMRRLPHDEEGGDHPAMSIDDLKRLADSPLVTIGSHSVTHPRLADLAPDDLRREIEESKIWIDANSDADVYHLGVPFGDAGSLDWAETAEVLLATGYKSVCTNFGGVNRPGHEDCLVRDGHRLTHLKRVPAPNTSDPHVLLSWVLGFANMRERFMPRTWLPGRR